MFRTFDPKPFNRIANDPDVRPWIGGSGELDLTNMVTNVNNICLITDQEDGGYLLENIGNGHYIAHTNSLKSARGRPMAELMRDGLHYLFTATNCIEISTSVADGNTNAMRWSKFAGFSEVYRRENCFDFNGELVGETFLTMTWLDWVKTAPKVREAGQEFHNFIESEQGHPNHPEEEIHDRMVGFAYLCCKEGNTAKAIAVYNDWAKVSRYQPIEVITYNPILLNIGTSIIELYNGSLKSVRTPKNI
jgi:hypothetical protein